ncbi:hypothetical protein [Streptomyces sp. SCSIO ZS0520]|uniref:hypothetical protein n=1 Tax=Streptomyces sp. SCSIO ZS0520 TaxID=2892996 RepID=UPI0021DA372E|nr:hypothetical protein [Streptomyces sp. SCSIO ZS0520]
MSSPPDQTAQLTAWAVPRLTEGTELVGEFAGSGYRVPPHLVHRYDGQVIHLPPLLYQATKLLAELESAGARKPRDGQAAMARVAAQLSQATGRAFTAEHIAYLIDKKLAPLGIARYSDGSPPDIPTANSFLALRFRKAVLSERATWFISGLFAWLFQPLVLMAVVATVMVGEVWVFMSQNVGGAVATTMAKPNSVLIVVLLTLASAAFHECGHAAACRYSKVKPGVMGCGIYLVWPAFYTDVTNSYRLGRAGRLRCDLGGVYFNGIFICGLILLYLQTGSPVILAAILFTNLEMAQQLLPTLRFDGYYIVSDLVGIPDLFKYIGPILRRAVLRKPADARLDALKKWPQIVVTAWVLTVLPAIAVQLGIVVTRLPQWTGAAWQSTSDLAGGALSGGNPVLGVLSALVQILLLLLPLFGVVLILWQLTSALVRFLFRRYVAQEKRERMGAWFGARRRVWFVLGLALCACLVGVLSWALTPKPDHSPSVATRPWTPPAEGQASPSPSPRDPRPSEPARDQDTGAAQERNGADTAPPPPGPSAPAQQGTDAGGPAQEEPAASGPSSAPGGGAGDDTPHARPSSPGPREDEGEREPKPRPSERRCTTILDLPLGPLLCR